MKLLVLVLLATLLIGMNEIPAAAADVPASPAELDLTLLHSSHLVVAGGRDRFLAAWQSDGDVWATLFASDGTCLTPPIPLDVSSDDDIDPAVAAVGEGFVVIWGGSGELESAHLDHDGIVLSSQTVASSSQPDARYIEVSAAAAADTVLVTYGGSLSPEPGALLLDSHGRLTRQIADFAPSLLYSNERLTSNGRDFLVVARNPDCPWEWGAPCAGLVATRISGDGAILGSTLLGPADAEPDRLATVFDGSRYLIAWQRGDTIGGAFLDTSGSVSSQTQTLAIGWDPKLLATPRGSALLWWREGTGDLAQEFDRAGSPIDLAPKRLATSGVIDVAASSGESHLALATKAVATRTLVREWSSLSALPIDANLESVTPEKFVRLSAREQISPAVAILGGTTVLVWSEYLPDEDRYGLFARRVQRNSDAVETVYRLPGSSQDQISAAVAAGDGEFLVAWRGDIEGREVAVARIGPDGRPIDAAPITIQSAAGMIYDDGVSIAWNGAVFLVAWEQSRTVRYGIIKETHVATVDASGRVVAGPLYLRDARDPVVVAAQQTFLVATALSQSAINVDFVDAACRTIRRAIRFDTELGKVVATPSVAFNGEEVLVVWTSQYGFADEIRGAVIPLSFIRPRSGRVHPVARPQTSFLITASGRSHLDPTVVWDGEQFFVAWSDGQDLERYQGNLDIVGAAVLRDGAWLGGEPLKLAATPQFDKDAALVATPEGITLAYSRMAPELPIGTTTRVFVRKFAHGSYATPAPSTR